MHRLEIWLYTHRHGLETLLVLVEGPRRELRPEEVIAATGIDFEEDREEVLEQGHVLPLSAAAFAELCEHGACSVLSLPASES